MKQYDYKNILGSILLFQFVIIRSFSAHLEPAQDHKNHNEFEQQIFLGDHSKEYHQLSEAEKADKLRVLAEKIDDDKNGKISEKELENWLEKNYIAHSLQRSKEFFSDIDEDGDGFVTMAEYEKNQYSHPNVPKDYKLKTKYQHEERRFEYADQDFSGNLTLEEFVYFLHPEEGKHMLDCIAQETIENMDRDDDNRLSVKDYIGERILDMNKEEFDKEVEKFEKELDKNGDGFMDKDEVSEWIKPDRRSTASTETKHLFEHGDKDKDGQLSYEEIVAMGQLLESSKATQYGDILKDIKPHNEEL